MVNLSEIEEYLKSEMSLVFNVQIRPSDEAIMLYLLKDNIAEKVKPGFTSTRQLNNLKKKLEEKYSKKVEVIFALNEDHMNLEPIIHQILNRKFDEKITSLYLSFRDSLIVDVFTEVLELTETLKTEITVSLSNMFDTFDLELGSIQWVEVSLNLPSLPAILRELKRVQPVSLEGLTLGIKKTYNSVSEKWVSHKLDHLRKQKLVMRQTESKMYVLMDKALGIIPSGVSKTSSDIERVLALGRKKW